MASGALLTPVAPAVTPGDPAVTSAAPPAVVTVVSDGGDAANSTAWPAELLMQDRHVLSVVAYSVLLLMAMPANIGVIVALLRKRKQMKRLNLMLLHLAIADLMVTCILMPVEIGWSISVLWLGGELLCRLLQFLRMFGLYLSNFVLVCISIDRYCAVVRPMAMVGTANRCKRTLTAAWALAAICSFPQVLIFQLHPHPTYRHLNVYQCVDKLSFPNKASRMAYFFFTMFFMYLLPLLVIIFCYTRIVASLTRRSAPTDSDSLFRANDSGFFVRARQRTLQMTFVIVLTFIVCWTPYYAICVWHFVHQESFKMIHPVVRRGLFIFAVANSVANPVVYGFYHSQLCQRLEVPTSSRGRSQSVELAILETAPTGDTLLRNNASSATLRSTTSRRVQGRDGVTRATALQPGQPPRLTSSPTGTHHAL